MYPIIQIDFWIGIVFWCIGQNCGLVTHITSFAAQQECLIEVRKMQKQLRDEKKFSNAIVEGRCSPQYIKVRAEDVLSI